MEGFMTFDNTEDAQNFGKMAGREEIACLQNSLIAWTTEFLTAKNSIHYATNNADHLDEMMVIAARRQFCREALEAADVALEPY